MLKSRSENPNQINDKEFPSFSIIIGKNGTIGWFKSVKMFLDQNGNKVELSFSQGFFGEEAKHVIVICQYKDKWLLTNHKVRGLEFPGGKCEAGETVEETAHREVYEETGGILESLQRLAEYKVTDAKGSFLKAVFWGHVQKIEKTDTYYETNGPIIVEGDLLNVRFGDEYSFIMKDQVLEECMHYIQRKQQKE
jgi:8-oxo-dGTP diphosphatase